MTDAQIEKLKEKYNKAHLITMYRPYLHSYFHEIEFIRDGTAPNTNNVYELKYSGWKFQSSREIEWETLKEIDAWPDDELINNL